MLVALCIHVPSAWIDAFPGAVVGALLGVLASEAVRYLRKPRVEFLGFDHETEMRQDKTIYGIEGVGREGIAQFHKVKFRVRGQPPGLAAARLEWRSTRQFAKWDELPEPHEGGRFVPNIVPSTFFLQLSDAEEYHLPILIDYDDHEGERVTDVFCGWWYGKGEFPIAGGYRVSASEHITVTLLGVSWQEGVKFWTRERSQTFSVSRIREV